MKIFNTILTFVYQFAMLFGFIANIGIGPITTRRIVLLISIMVLLANLKKLKLAICVINHSKFKISLFLLLGCLFITLFHYVGSTSTYFNKYLDPRELFALVLSIIIIGLWCVIEIKTFERFAKLVVGVVLLQSVFTFISAVYQPFRIYVAEHFMTESYLERSQNIIYGMGGRAAGVGIAWSSGALLLAFGCLLLISLKKKNTVSTTMFSICYAVIVSATALMGRTGLIAEFVFLLYYGISSGKAKNIVALSLTAIISFAVLAQVLSMYENHVAERTMEWIMEFTNSDRVEEINSKVVDDGFPPFSSDFIIGTGLKMGRYKNFRFTSDSGYIRNYTAIGVVGMFFYYVGILYLLLSVMTKRIDKDTRRLIWVGIIILFTVEYKEPFVGMPSFPWILFTMTLLLNIDNISKRNENINSRRFLPTIKSDRGI